MKILKVTLMLVTLLILHSCGIARVKKVKSDSKPINHDAWDMLLKKHVTEEGIVDYKGFMGDKNEFDAYLKTLSENHPNDKNWSDLEKFAYWINAYNAFTVKLILDNYPIASIKDIKNGIPFVSTVWDIKFIKIENETYCLNNLEHGILRKQYDNPRIHFAVNCASYSCPRLRAEAYRADRLEEQLEDQAKYFINNPKKNIITENEIKLSKLFTWYEGDFKEDGKEVVDFVNKYANNPIKLDAKIDYLDYLWTLNE